MLLVGFIFSLLPFSILSEVQVLQPDKFSELLNENNIVILAYLVDWCPYSNAMKNVLDGATEELNKRPKLAESVKISIVDCVSYSEFCQQNRIFKFPTSFIYTRGVKVNEYRGERSVDAIISHLEDLTRDKSIRLNNVGDLNNLKKRKKNFLIGFFSQTSPKEISSFVAHFKEFYVAENFLEEMQNGESVRCYNAREDRWIYFDGELTDFSLLGDWVKKVMKEKITYMTFQNAEELTDERKPLIILFLSKNKEQMLESFERQFDVILHQIDDKVKYIHVDCHMFEHPLYHMGKSSTDCPLLVIDSFAHMFMFPGSVEEAFNSDMSELVEFINDFFSGKLHKQLHNLDTKDIGKSDNMFKNVSFETPQPKESKFKQLAPSSNRYSFIDEL